MATDMADLAASIGRMAKQQNPEAYGEWDDAELGAQLLIQQQGQVHALFQSSNEMDPQGNAVVRPDRERGPNQAWSKAETIGAPGLGDRYVPPTTNEIMASENPFRALLESVSSRVIGPGRPRSVAAADPYGLEAALAGKGHFPVFMGTVDEVGGAGRGLFSRVDDAVSRLPAKGAHPNKIAGILKSNASTEELAYRQVPEFLASKGNATVTPGELQAHLAAHPAPMPAVKTLADRGGVSADEIRAMGHGPITADQINAQAARDSSAGPTKYSQYQVPGGNQYRETLLTLPEAGEEGFQRLLAQRDAVNAEIQNFHQVRGDDRFAPHPPELVQKYNDLQAKIDAMQGQQFRSGHFDEPNILVHTRSNMRTLPTGERGRFLEEVQSDWHQRGKTHGYQTGENLIDGQNYEWWNNRADSLFNMRTNPNLRSQISAADLPRLEQDLALARENRNRLSIKAADVVPDAPFKESWPDLGVKQQLLEAAQDPETQWIGFTSGQTQANRYDLSKQISRLEYLPKSGPRLGTIRAYDHAGNQVIDKIADVTELPDIIGKEAATKLLATEAKTGTGAGRAVHILKGLDLQVGGEGMRHFYDQLLPKRLEKIVKPFGGTVERSAVAEGKEPAWIVRLTPEMKARILKEGLPLMTISGIAAASQLGTDSDAK